MTRILGRYADPKGVSVPFKSEKQRRYLWLKHPDIAKRWADAYPTKKDLPMYADKKDGEKQSAAQILLSAIPKYLNWGQNWGVNNKANSNIKESDSKQEYVKLPVQHGPTAAGDAERQPTGATHACNDNNKQLSSTTKQDQLTADALFKKLAVVLSPRLMQEIEDEQALQQAREAQRMPQNVGIKPMPPAVNSILPPMGMTQPAPNPAQAQPAQPAQPATGQLASVGGGASPNANPINAFGGLSSTGDINGNAALGTQNMAGGEKMAGMFDALRSAPPKQPPTFEKSLGRGIMNILINGSKAKPNPTPATVPPPAPPSGKSSAAAGNDALAWLVSIDNVDIPDPDDLDYDERAKSAAEKWSAVGLWDRIRAKRERGGKPAKPGDKDYPDAKSWKKVTGISEKKSGLFDFLTLKPSVANDWSPPAAPRYDLNDDDRDWDRYEKEQAKFEQNLRQYLKTKNYSKIQPHHYEPGGTPWSMLGPDKKYHEIWMPEDGEPVNKPTPLADMYDFDTPDKAYRKGPGLALVKTSASSPAWQRAAGKNDEGGLNAKGRASYNKATGGNLKAPVTEKNPTGKAKKRRKSFCSRMCGMKQHETGAKTKADPDSRINKALRKWNCKCSSATQFGVKCASSAARRLLTKLMKDTAAGNISWHGTGLQSARGIMRDSKFFANPGDVTFSRYLPLRYYAKGLGAGYPGTAFGFARRTPEFIAATLKRPEVRDAGNKRIMTLGRHGGVDRDVHFLSDAYYAPTNVGMAVPPRSGVLRYAFQTGDKALDKQFRDSGARLIPKPLQEHFVAESVPRANLPPLKQPVGRDFYSKKPRVQPGQFVLNRNAALRHLGEYGRGNRLAPQMTHPFNNTLNSVYPKLGPAARPLSDNRPTPPAPVLRPTWMQRITGLFKRSAAYDYGHAVAQALTKTAVSEDLRRALTAALVSAGGGLALGAYPGWKLQQMSAQAGNSDFVNSFVGRLPIAAGGAVTGGLYNYLSARDDKKKQQPGTAQPASV